jgi:hypothetical protein
MRDILRESCGDCVQTFEESTLGNQLFRIGLGEIKLDLEDLFRCLLFIEAHYPLGIVLVYAAFELVLAIRNLLRRYILYLLKHHL